MNRVPRTRQRRLPRGKRLCCYYGLLALDRGLGSRIGGIEELLDPVHFLSLADRGCGTAQGVERAQETAVGLVLPRNRAGAAPAGAAERVQAAVVAHPGVRVGLHGASVCEGFVCQRGPDLGRGGEPGSQVHGLVTGGKAGDDVIGLEMRKLMKRGAEVYYYDDGFHHSKVMMVDSLFCTVGTTNLDARSLCFDYEVNAFIFSPRVTHELQQIFADDVRHSTLLTPEVWKQRFPLGRRIRSRFFTIAKRFM